MFPTGKFRWFIHRNLNFAYFCKLAIGNSKYNLTVTLVGKSSHRNSECACGFIFCNITKDYTVACEVCVSAEVGFACFAVHVVCDDKVLG